MKYPVMYNPLETLRITQGEGYAVAGVQKCTYSHTDRAAVDEGCEDGGRCWCAMPKDGPDLKCVKVWPGVSGCNGGFFLTTSKVILADGRISTACLEMLHCDDDRYKTLGIAIGKQFAAGRNFYSEGKKGATAYHLHLQVGENEKLEKNKVGSWRFKKELHPYRALWLEKGSKAIKGSYNYPWVYWPDSEPIGEVTIRTTYRRRSGPGTEYEQVKEGTTALTAAAGTYAVWEICGDCYLIRPACKLAYGGESKPEWICCGENGTFKAW